MNPTTTPSGQGGALRKAARIIVVSSVMLTFISYWRTAAVVLCDLGSTAYYIGGIVEQAVGPAAPWFILAVMGFSYAVRSVYIESCSLFIRGGVYRVVKEALGRLAAKIAVSALIFDYLLTGPISGVSAGHYLMGLLLDSLRILNDSWVITDDGTRSAVKSGGAVVIAIAVTLYFYRLNIRGIHESSDRALKIMIATTVMVIVILAWCGLTLLINGIAVDEFTGKNTIPWQPDLSVKKVLDPKTAKPKVDEKTGETEDLPDPIGFLAKTPINSALRPTPPREVNWFGFIGFLGIMIAFGHSILAMSGEETLAQVYREVEAPKLVNFRKAAFIVFLYSLVFTAGISFLAVLLIPQTQRVTEYSENLISGLAMNVIGPDWLRLCLNAFVVVVGFLILSGAVNTAIIGSNGVLNRVSEDGVMPEWFLKPHGKYGTTYRILTMIVILQLAIILLSKGDVLILGEAYAFGVVWSFVFQGAAMVVLRFKDTRTREYKVPFNFSIGSVEIPFGLLVILFVLVSAALLNLFTKPLATIFGAAFTGIFFVLFYVSEMIHERKLKGGHHKHLEQFNQDAEDRIDAQALGIDKPFRRLVAIRSTQNLFMLEKTLADTEAETTDVIVMTAKSVPEGDSMEHAGHLDKYDQELMTAVVQRAETAGKQVHPLIVPTNNPVYALLRTARDLKVHELVIGASNKFTADEQIDQVALLWINLHKGNTEPLTIRILSKDRDLHFDLGGGNRIPRQGEAKARSIADLRQAGVGADRVILVQPDTKNGLDLFQSILTALDPMVKLDVLVMPADEHEPASVQKAIEFQTQQVNRKLTMEILSGSLGESIVQYSRKVGADIIVVPISDDIDRAKPLALPGWVVYVLQNARCRVMLVANPMLPKDLAD